jgi:hypothetical protein
MSNEVFLNIQAPAESNNPEAVFAMYGYETIIEPIEAKYKEELKYYEANRGTIKKNGYPISEPHSPSEWFKKVGDGLLISRGKHQFVLVDPQIAENAMLDTWIQDKQKEDRKKLNLRMAAQNLAFKTAIGFKAFSITNADGAPIDLTMDGIFDLFADDADPDEFAKDIAPTVAAISAMQVLLTSVSEPIELTLTGIQELATELHQKITTRSNQVEHAKSTEEFLRLYGQLAGVAFANPDFALLRDAADSIDLNVVTNPSSIDELKKINTHLTQLLHGQQA